MRWMLCDTDPRYHTHTYMRTPTYARLHAHVRMSRSRCIINPDLRDMHEQGMHARRSYQRLLDAKYIPLELELRS